MADDKVKAAQRYVNSYNVSGIPKIEEDGITGWVTMRALTRVLQYELGITNLSDSFGPATLAALQQQYPNVDGTVGKAAILRVLQSGLYCKGYDGGDISGTYNSATASGVLKLKQNAGVDAAWPNAGVPPKLFKAVLNMDAYVITAGGSAETRAVQRWMNASYVNRRDFFVIPCDGFFTGDVQKSLLLAIQYALGMDDNTATGSFGPATQSGLKNNVLVTGSTGTFVRLFTAGMIFNQRPSVTFSDTFTSTLANQVAQFQDFSALSVTSKGDYPTWASLLVSTGDPTRKGAAADCVTQVTNDRALSLKNSGYKIVGRYLSNAPGSSLNKKIQDGEIFTIVGNGLSIFPIYQTNGGTPSYFSRLGGIGDAYSAVEWAESYGFKAGTTIYFAVDFDALDYQVTDLIIPHFEGIRSVMETYGKGYKTGIYGPRNVCSRVSAYGLATTSFVSDMSTKFSGNLGFPLPTNWAFDQISTVTVGSGSGAIQIDNNISSGRDLGQKTFNVPPSQSNLDVEFDMSRREALLAEVRTYLESIGVPEKGGPPPRESQTLNSTGDSFDVVMQADVLLTNLARSLRMRKAAIVCPILWELRKYNIDDDAADSLVRNHYSGSGASPVDDSSTGIGQIFGRTAIRARNYGIQQGIITGQMKDPDVGSDVYSVWQQLQDSVFNISQVPLVLIHAASLIGQTRPSLTYSEADTQRILARYNGTGDDANQYGQQLIGIYRVFEKYYAPLRQP